MPTAPSGLLGRIDAALDATLPVFAEFTPGRVAHKTKGHGDPLTEADTRLDSVLKGRLPQDGDGWLSEETADSHERLERNLTWIVDPLDGTREFVEGIPEFCVSIAAVVDGVPVAGGVLNPAVGIRVTGAVGHGIFLGGDKIDPPSISGELHDLEVLASRSEVRRGEWDDVRSAGVKVTPMGSVAYKMARVAAGLSDTTWTLVPKHEWDVAGGAALLLAAGSSAVGLDGRPLTFNTPNPLLDGVIAVPSGFERHIPTVLSFRG